MRDAIGGIRLSGLSKGEDTSGKLQAICSQVNDYLIGKTKIDNFLETEIETIREKTRLLIEVRFSLRLNQSKPNGDNLLNELLDPRLGGVCSIRREGT